MTQQKPTVHEEANEEGAIKIAIQFCPLLIKITNALAFPTPKYRFVHETSNTTAVFISDGTGNLSSVYIGGEACDVIISCEKAAEVAVVDLIKKYQLTIHDITAARKGSVQTCAALRTLRRFETELEHEQMKKAWDTIADSIHETKIMNPITIDYIDTMYHILKKIELTVGPIETVQTSKGHFLAWIILPTSEKLQQTEYIFGPTCKSRQAAQNRLARKVIIFLIPIYKLQIVDANYDRNSMGNKYNLNETTRKLYLAAKEVILPFNDHGEYAIVDLPSGYSTPTDDAQQIAATTLKHPPPPKKRRYSAQSDVDKQTTGTNTPAFFEVPDNLLATFVENTNKHNDNV